MHDDFIKFGRVLFEQGLNNSHSGNMSVSDGEHIFITRHGGMLGHLSALDVVETNLNDTSKDKEASLEIKVHRAIYRACPKAKAIAHAHPPYAIALSLHRERIVPVDFEGMHYIPEIPVLCCEKTIGSDEVAEKLPALIDKYKVAIVRGHGAFAAAETLEEATLLLSVLESVCRLVYLDGQLRK